MHGQNISQLKTKANCNKTNSFAILNDFLTGGKKKEKKDEKVHDNRRLIISNRLR